MCGVSIALLSSKMSTQLAMSHNSTSTLAVDNTRHPTVAGNVDHSLCLIQRVTYLEFARFRLFSVSHLILLRMTRLLQNGVT